jgi:hypothetical protein
VIVSSCGGVRDEVGGLESCRLDLLAMAVHSEDAVEKDGDCCTYIRRKILF